MSKQTSRPSTLAWTFAGVGLAMWSVGTMGWLPVTFLHPIGYALLFAAALTAEPLMGRSSASNLQLAYTVVGWLMVALIAVTEGLSLGGILFFGLIALTMTFIYFHPIFRLSTRVSLYLVLLLIVWAPPLYGIAVPTGADEIFGAGTRAALTVLALLVSAIFFGLTVRWLTVQKGSEG